MLDFEITQLPFAASENLALYLSRHFRADHNIVGAALQRVWLSASTGDQHLDLDWRIERCSIKYVLERTQEDSNDLFEKERQNLYIDGLKQVEIWTDVLKNIDLLVCGYQELLEDWVLAGLRYLVDFLNNEVEFDGPLGITSQVDVFMLFMRVIKLAGVIIHWTKILSSNANDIDWSAKSADALHVLGNLGVKGKEVCIHRRLICVIDEILDMQ